MEIAPILGGLAGLGTAVANIVALRINNKQVNTLLEKLGQATEGLGEATQDISARFAHTQRQMDRLLKLLERLIEGK